MRRTVGIATLVVLMLLACEVGVRAVEPALPAVNTWREPLIAQKVRRMDALALKGSVDVVFAGSSQMLFAADPAILQRDLGVNWSAYNAGLWGAPPVVNEHWILKVVVPRVHPKTVVIGVSMADFVDSGTDGPTRTYFEANAVRGGVIGTLERIATRASAVIRHRRDLRSPKIFVDSVSRRFRHESGPGIPTTAVSDSGTMTKKGAETFRSDKLARSMIAGVIRSGWTLSVEQRRAFERLVRGLQGQGIEVLVADMAISGPMIDLLGNTGYGTYRTFIRKEASSLGVPVLDMASGVSNPQFFFDYDHVNRSGANLFNTVLARALDVGAPGGFNLALKPDVVSKPLAPAVASDVLREEATVDAPPAKQPLASAPPVDRPAVPSQVPSAPSVELPAASPAVPKAVP